ncbi:MAG: hypothetical protein ABJA82_04285, partial [Myxococcales bacterium]
MKMIITRCFRFWFRFLSPAALLCGILACGMLACGTAPPPPLATKPAAEAAPDPRLQPTFNPAPPATAETRQDQRTVQRREILDAVWRTVRDMHYDPRLGGLDWPAVRRRYEPVALGAPSDAAFYRALNDMIGELGQSHMVVTGPGADDDAAEDTAAVQGGTTTGTTTGTITTPAGTAGNAPTGGSPPPPSPPAAATPGGTTAPAPATLSGPPGAPMVVTGVGDPGVTVRSIEGRPTVTAVRPASSAARHRLA